jgi:nitrogen fixation protein FixH
VQTGFIDQRCIFVAEGENMKRLGISVFCLFVLVVGANGPSAAQSAAKAAPAKFDIAFQTTPKSAIAGENTLEVTVKDAAGKPVTDADVSVLLVMPAMPAMKMAEMRNDVKLTHTSGGKYTGKTEVGMSGNWNVTVSVKQAGKEVAQKKTTLTAR